MVHRIVILAEQPEINVWPENQHVFCIAKCFMSKIRASDIAETISVVFTINIKTLLFRHIFMYVCIYFVVCLIVLRFPQKIDIDELLILILIMM